VSTPRQEIPRRGDIFWADLPSAESVGSEQYGRRPVLVLSADTINRSLPICIVVPLTSVLDKAKTNRQHRIIILERYKIADPSDPNYSLCKGDSLALTEQIRCISRNRLGDRRVASVEPIGVNAVEAGVRYVLGLI